MAGASGLTTLGAIPPFLLGAQAVWVREDLGIGIGALGGAISAFFAAAAIGSTPAGLVLERWGRRVGLALAGLLVLLGGAAMATLVRGPVTLVAATVVLGLGNAACQTAANLSMARALPQHRRGLGFGVKQSAVPLAIMLGGLAVPTVGGLLGWRSTFATTAVVGALVAAGAVRAARGAPAAPVDRSSLDRPPRLALLLSGLGITFASSAANFLGSFIATWAHEAGMTATQGGLLMAAGSAGSIAVRVWSGHRADHREGRNLPVVAAQMYVGAITLVGVAVGTPATVVVFGLLAFAVGWAWPGLLLYAVARVGRDTPATASGVVQAGAFVGGSAGPLLLGLLAEAAGFRTAWLAGSACFVVAGTLILASRALFRADLRDRPPRTPLDAASREVR